MEEDLPGLLRQTRQTNPDALVLCSYTFDAYRLLEMLDQQGWRLPVLPLAVAPAMPLFGQKADRQAEAVLGPLPCEADDHLPYPSTRRFVKAFRQASGFTPSYHAASAYTALLLLGKVVRQVQSLEQDKVREYLLSLDTVTVVGRFKVDHQERQVGR